MKWIILTYFGVSLTMITLSTIMVANGRRPPLEQLRLLIFIPLPFDVPQLITWNQIVPWLTHLSYRMYSMMMTTTILGLAFGLIYKPRTWCTVCPIATISDVYIDQYKKSMK